MRAVPIILTHRITPIRLLMEQTVVGRMTVMVISPSGVTETSPSLPELRWELYKGLRHEILNEDCRAVVYNDLWSWIEKHL